MTEAEVLEAEIKNEEAFGDPKAADALREKKAKLTVVPRETKPEEVEKPIITETKPETIVVDPDKPVGEKKDEKEIVTEIKDEHYDPFKKKEGEKKEITKEATAPTKTVDELARDKNYETFKQKAELLDSLESDNYLKTLIEARKNGKSTFEVAMELTPVDYSKLNQANAKGEYPYDEALAREYYEKIENLKDTALEDAIAEFTAEDESSSKKRLRKGFTKDLDNKQTDKLQDYISNVSASAKQNEQNNTKFHTEVEDFMNGIRKEKRLYGLQLTDAKELDLFESRVHNFFPELFNKDGSVNLEPVIKSIYFDMLESKRRAEIAKKAKSEGQIEVLETVHQPDRNEQTLQNRKPATPVKDGAELTEKYYGTGTVK